MIIDSKLTDIFWKKTLHIGVHIKNRVMLRNNTDKTTYDLWKGRPTNMKHFRVFEANATSKEKMAEWESLILVWTKEYLLATKVHGKRTGVTL